MTTSETLAVLSSPPGSPASREKACAVERLSAQPEDVDLRTGLEALRVQLADVETGEPLEQLLSSISAAAEKITVEHAGMAEELLCTYEQLGVIFEVTRKLSTVQNEDDVVDLFVDSLRHSFGDREVFAAQPGVRGQSNIEPRAGQSQPAVGRAAPQRKSALKASYGAGTAKFQACFPGHAPSSPTDWLEALVDRAAERASVLVDHPSAGTARDGVVEALVGPVFAGDSFVSAIVLTRKEKSAAFRASDMLLLESLTLYCGDLIRNHRLVHELRDMSVAMVRSLVNAVDQKDQYTSGHSLRVGYYATLLGKTLGLGEGDLQMLQWSALLHDVGKIGIRDEVLNKKGKLTTEEFDHIKEHPRRSYLVVKEVPQLAQALDGVLHHHEKYNGKGYPAGLAGEEIPLQARIVQIADIFDALTSDRSYRPSHTWQEALDILNEEAGETVDARLQKVFACTIRATLDRDPNGWSKLVRRAQRPARVRGEQG